MISLITAAAIAAAAPATPAPVDAHARHQQMAGGMENGQMADMKDCCCKDMMSKMHGGHGMEDMQEHKGHTGR